MRAHNRIIQRSLVKTAHEYSVCIDVSVSVVAVVQVAARGYVLERRDELEQLRADTDSEDDELRRLETRVSPQLASVLAHPFNGPFSGTTRVSRYYQKGRTNLEFAEARDGEWQWHQLDHMQVCTLFLTYNHASTPPLSFYRPDALPAAQPTASKQ